MRYFFLLFLHLSLFANDTLLDLYKQNGSSAIEKVFDEELSSREYWDKKLQDVDTRFGYFESIKYILACNKNDESLKLYTKSEQSSFELNEDFSAFIGKKKGDKQREGDLKTPIGVYKFIQKLDKVDSFYGPLAFVTSYPNTYDKIQGKNGSGIWVHGLPTDQNRDDYTKGCIAINNDNLKHVEQAIDFKKAIVYIDTNSYPVVEKDTLTSLLSQLFLWRKAWKENDINTYLNFYDQEFKRQNSMNLQAFSAYKTRIFAKNEYKQILFTDINISPYPMSEKKDVFFISFNEKYDSRNYQFTGDKELYVQLHENTFTILAEK